MSEPRTPLEDAAFQLLVGVLNDGWPCPRCRSRPSGKGRLSCKYCDCVRPLRPGMAELMQEFMPAAWARWQEENTGRSQLTQGEERDWLQFECDIGYDEETWR